MATIAAAYRRRMPLRSEHEPSAVDPQQAEQILVDFQMPRIPSVA
jgi:hypothetical protein